MSKKIPSTLILLLSSVLIQFLLFYFYYSPETKILAGDEERYLSTAKSILNGGDWHPHFLWPPLQPITIAFFLKLFGDSLIALQVFQYLLIILSAFIVRDITYKESQDHTAAQIAFAILLLLPSWLAYSQYLWPEVIHITLFLSIVWINLYCSPSLFWMILSGIIIGIALLYKNLLLAFIPFLFWPQLVNIFYGNKRLKQIFSILIQLFVMLIVLSPVMIKSKSNHDSWLISNSSAFNIYAGIKDEARQNFVNVKVAEIYGEYMRSGDGFEQREDFIKEKIQLEVEEKGYFKIFATQVKKQYFRLFDFNSFLSYQFKGNTAEGQINKYAHNLDDGLPKLLIAFDKFLYLLILTAALANIILYLKNSVASQQMLIFLFYNLGLFLLLHVKTRFILPMIPIFAINSGLLFATLKQRNFEVTKSKKIIIALIFSFVLFISAAGPILDKYFPI